LPRRSCSEPATPHIIWPTRGEGRGGVYALTGTASANGCAARAMRASDPAAVAPELIQKSADECARGRETEARGYYEQGRPRLARGLQGAGRKPPTNRGVPPLYRRGQGNATCNMLADCSRNPLEGGLLHVFVTRQIRRITERMMCPSSCREQFFTIRCKGVHLPPGYWAGPQGLGVSNLECVSLAPLSSCRFWGCAERAMTTDAAAQACV